MIKIHVSYVCSFFRNIRRIFEFWNVCNQGLMAVAWMSPDSILPLDIYDVNYMMRLQRTVTEILASETFIEK